eukprot:CAMPEP_0198232298 /NCGR_PEP_ID=MMETSP1445-20131203/115656_1 /TAXON_ID=36898 /ORGANISM="Pyramimonas sp., Strain CCMP2087" /LENGTH=123 /DNA_ID=CAMNT_0043912963 /DNA_START=571 /DNA_END=943 /DNA_ORIENTATION=-
MSHTPSSLRSAEPVGAFFASDVAASKTPNAVDPFAGNSTNARRELASASFISFSCNGKPFTTSFDVVGMPQVAAYLYLQPIGPHQDEHRSKGGDASSAVVVAQSICNTSVAASIEGKSPLADS